MPPIVLVGLQADRCITKAEPSPNGPTSSEALSPDASNIPMPTLREFCIPLDGSSECKPASPLANLREEKAAKSAETNEAISTLESASVMRHSRSDVPVDRESVEQVKCALHAVAYIECSALAPVSVVSTVYLIQYSINDQAI